MDLVSVVAEVGDGRVLPREVPEEYRVHRPRLRKVDKFVPGSVNVDLRKGRYRPESPIP